VSAESKPCRRNGAIEEHHEVVVDTGNLKEIEALADLGILDGVTPIRR
jgi:transaldolase